MGEDYLTVLVHDAGESAEQPTAAERTIGDLLDPLRPGDVTTVVNVVSKATGQDAADWPWARLVGMLSVLEASAAQYQ